MSSRKFDASGYPQLCVLDTDGRVECRVYNWKVFKNPEGKLVDVQTDRWVWSEAVVVAILSCFPFYLQFTHRGTHVLVTASLLALYGIWRCQTVLWESVIVIPPHGIQIEIHRGIWGIPVFASRKFIPTFLIRDVIINEALRRWNVVFYLAILSVSHNGEFQLDVLFENTLPEFRVLQRVHGIVKRRMLKGS